MIYLAWIGGAIVQTALMLLTFQFIINRTNRK